MSRSRVGANAVTPARTGTPLPLLWRGCAGLPGAPGNPAAPRTSAGGSLTPVHHPGLLRVEDAGVVLAGGVEVRPPDQPQGRCEEPQDARREGDHDDCADEPTHDHSSDDGAAAYG